MAAGTPPPVGGPWTSSRWVAGADGLRLAVHEAGDPDRPMVLLVHGYPDDHAVWDLVAEHLRADHRLVAYDVRGAGASAVPADRRGYRVDRLVADLAAVIDAVSPEEPVHLVAHDWGSIQSWSAVIDPAVADRIATFTSISGPGLDHVSAWVRARRSPGGGRWRQLLRQGSRSWYVALFQTPLPARGWRLVAKRWRWAMEQREAAATDDRWPSPNLLADAVHGLELYRANAKGPRIRPGTRRASARVLVLIPLDDPYVTPALWEGIERFAPDLRRVEVPGKHWLPRSQPRVVADAVAAHVAGGDGR
jgi:pimeloyl-ACP methyl ester carboxylesterase